MPDARKQFGSMIREKRKVKGYTLRKFAGEVGISPTYLSRVEQGKVERPPTAERVQKMAELLGENADQWIAIAGRMPTDVSEIIKNEPEAMPALLRAAKGLTADELRELTRNLEKQQEKGGTE